MIEILQRAADANAFKTTDTSAGYINPEYWNRRVLDYIKDNIVIVGYAKRYDDLLKDGDTLNVTIRNEPTAAVAVAETDDVSISTWDVRSVTFSPTEYAKAYQITDKELKRAFFNVMESMAEDIGYALALAQENKAVEEIYANAGNLVIADGLDDTDTLTASNQLDHGDVINAMKENSRDKFRKHTALFISAGQMASLMKDSAFLTADKFGLDKAAVRNGYLGSIFGIPVHVADAIPESGNEAKAILMSSNEAIGIVEKKFDGIRKERRELGRYTNVVGVSDFDIKVLRPNSLCLIKTYVE